MTLLYLDTTRARHGRTRYISLITFLLCSMMVSSLLIYTDSRSIYVWNWETNVGPASFIISSESVHEYVEEFRNVPGIVCAETIELCWCELLTYIIPPVNQSVSVFLQSSDQKQHTYRPLAPYEPPPVETPAIAAYLKPSFRSSFPELYAAIEGRLPNNDSEIAVASWLADRFRADPGTQVNYTRGFPLITSNVTIVGIFSQPVTNNSLELHYIKADVIVTAGLFGTRDYESYVYADIDRSLISPQNPRGALNYLLDIDEKLRRVDPEFRVTKQWTMFYVDDLLAIGVNSYIAWLNDARVSQMLRSSGFLFLGFIVSSMGVHFYRITKETEVEVLRARGASSTRMIFTQYRDVLVLTAYSIPLGLLGGFLLSRLGLVCVSFFTFDLSRIPELPFLLSINAIVTVILLTFLVPFLMIIGQGTTDRIRSSPFVSGSRLAKYTRRIHTIRWELLTLLASLIVFGSIIQQGSLVAQTPDFKIALVVIPLVLALSITSLSIKGIKILSAIISRILNPLFSKVPSSIGIRRFGRNNKIAGPTMLVLILTMSLTWSSLIVSTTVPSTALGHTRFAIGGDLAFKLDTINTSKWNSFTQNVSTHELVEAVSQIIVRTLYMTSSVSSATDFVSITPSEYLQVGYDSTGTPLEQSPLGSFLDLLDANPSGVVITRDLSVLYDLKVGDTLRACTINDTEFIPHPFSILGITDCLPESLVTESGFNFLEGEEIGLGRVWMNSEYAEPLFSGGPISNSLLCVRMTDISECDELVESIIDSGGLSAIDELGIATVESELGTALDNPLFVIERSIDTMLALISMFSVVVIFTIYSIESKDEYQKQNAILLTLGVEHNSLKTTNVVEILAASLVSLVVLLPVSPIFIISSIVIYLIDIGARMFQFPSPILITTPWISILIILVTLVTIIALLPLIGGKPESRTDLLSGSFRNTPFEAAERRAE